MAVWIGALMYAASREFLCRPPEIEACLNASHLLCGPSKTHCYYFWPLCGQHGCVCHVFFLRSDARIIGWYGPSFRSHLIRTYHSMFPSHGMSRHTSSMLLCVEDIRSFVASAGVCKVLPLRFPMCWNPNHMCLRTRSPNSIPDGVYKFDTAVLASISPYFMFPGTVAFSPDFSQALACVLSHMLPRYLLCPKRPLIWQCRFASLKNWRVYRCWNIQISRTVSV
ncbi:hypothetical protein EDD16DRAFT_423566 [Pisolithus croceorrhizus]|nr:hypothetical protein EDD16DRAFT_423566 [Pisolithus croceorrhizus]